jgi:hypothetical protein
MYKYTQILLEIRFLIVTLNRKFVLRKSNYLKLIHKHVHKLLKQKSLSDHQ